MPEMLSGSAGMPFRSLVPAFGKVCPWVEVYPEEEAFLTSGGVGIY
jgi:hypothetical protein